MNIYIIRHGQTPWNALKKIQGRADTELNEEGIQKAIITGQAFSDVEFDLVFTSPLKRARHTAELFLGGKEVPIVIDERLIELGFGEYEGLSTMKENFEIPDPEFMDFFHHPERYKTAPGGESLACMGERTKDFMWDIMRRPELQGKNILVSSHGAAVRGLLNGIREFELSDFWHGGVPKNCSIALIKVRDQIPELIYEDRIFYEEDPERMAIYG